jgi:putative zinc finger/helix-turn-helix YgiT family protein
MTARRENVKYDACGLPYVTLVGVEVTRCAQCGDFEVALPRIEELHHSIAAAVVRKPGRLEGMEIRFLRKWLGFSGTEFAAHMGVSPATVSRWETGSQRIGGAADRTLRLMVLSREPSANYSLALLREVDADRPAGFRIGLAAGRSGWRTAAA